MGCEEVISALTENNSGILGVSEWLVFILYALLNLKHAVSHGYLRAPQELLASYPSLLVCQWLPNLFNHII